MNTGAPISGCLPNPICTPPSLCDYYRGVTPCRHSTHPIHLIAPGRVLYIAQAYVVDRLRKPLIV